MKTIVITGGTRGIGRGLAKSFLERGCTVVLTSRSADSAALATKELAEETGVDPDKAIGLACEITDVESIDRLWADATEAVGTVDVFINNAGMSIPRGPLWELEPEDLRSIVDTNLTGAMLVARRVIGGMIEQGGGQFWLTEGFGSGGQTQVGIAPYGSTKRAVNYLVKGLVKDTEETPVQVCALAPGIVITDLLLDDYEVGSPYAERAYKFFKILGDRVETVTPWLADQVLATDKSGTTVNWLSRSKAAGRFFTAWRGRDPFEPEEAARLVG